MNKITILGIAIFAMGIIILPETMALFQEQHTFYNMTSEQSVPCLKCHSDVQTQLMNSPDSPHSEFKCENCHTINMIQSGAHAATLPLCINCHDGNMTPYTTINSHELGNTDNCMKCHDGPNLETGLDVYAEITNDNEVHKSFISGATNDTMMKGSNEACIGCHTGVNVNITWSKPTTMKFNVSYTDSGIIVNDFRRV